jgi:putative spermidine/putrescine transport system permease protein
MTARPATLAGWLPLALPAIMLVAFFVLPFGTMIAMSFFKNLGGGAFEATLTLDNYLRLFSPFFGRILLVSLGIALAVSVIAIVVAFPFTWLLVNAPRSTQVVWLIGLLALLSLSEAILGFAWSSLLSRTAGISNLFVWLGLAEGPFSLSPSLGAVLAGISYIAMPYAVLILYPILARVDPEIEAAARTLGASPLRTFLGVLVPMHREAIITTFLMIFVFTLGSYLIPQILGRPTNWTLSVQITDQALLQSNLPFAAALSIFLVLVTILLVLTIVLMGRKART